MSLDSFLNRDKRHGTAAHRRSKHQERELAKRGNGKLTPGSGNGALKGDIQKYNGVWRIEAKTTKNKSFSVTKEMISKIETAALSHDEIPAIVIEFLDESGRPEMEVAVVPSYLLDIKS